MIVSPDGKVELARPGQHDSEVGREHRVNRFLQQIIGFDGTLAHSQHQVVPV